VSGRGWVLLITLALGLGGTILAAWVWISLRRRDVVRLVRDGKAEWAALGLIKVGARHLDGGTERPGSQPIGIVSIKTGVLTWEPNAKARKRGHKQATSLLRDLQFLHSQKQRLPTGVPIRVVHLGVKDEVAVAWFYTEAGRLAAWFAPTA
jgi:hypothetical protein